MTVSAVGAIAAGSANKRLEPLAFRTTEAIFHSDLIRRQASRVLLAACPNDLFDPFLLRSGITMFHRNLIGRLSGCANKRDQPLLDSAGKAVLDGKLVGRFPIAPDFARKRSQPCLYRAIVSVFHCIAIG